MFVFATIFEPSAKRSFAHPGAVVKAPANKTSFVLQTEPTPFHTRCADVCLCHHLRTVGEAELRSSRRRSKSPGQQNELRPADRADAIPHPLRRCLSLPPSSNRRRGGASLIPAP